MNKIIRKAAIVIAFVIISSAGPWHVTRAKVLELRATTVPVSSSVLDTFARLNDKLALLVLWRGTPKWWMGPRTQGDSYTGTGDAFTATLRYNSVSLELAYNGDARTVTIQKKTTDLGSTSNVVFVDHVDSDHSISIRNGGMLPTDGASLDPQNGGLGQLFRQSPEIVEFVRCDNPDEFHLGRIACDSLKH